MAGDEFEKLVKIGSGSFGSAWLVCRKGLTNRKLEVLKEVNIRGLCEKDVNQALTEVEVLARCKHEFIIAYCQAFFDKDLSTLSIIMEYAPMGDLHQQITQRRGLYFPQDTVLRWFSHLNSALDYIHNLCILHRDVKPQNMFLTSQKNLKLGDFGIARVFTSPSDRAHTLIGTPLYLSPEVYRQEPYGFASDMWGAGCVLYEMCCLSVPFSASNMAALVAQIELAHYTPLPSHYSQALHDLVHSLLTTNPQDRLTARDVVKMDITHFHSKRAIDSKTYTIAKNKKDQRLFLGSPDLSAMIQKQRSQSLECRQIVWSADNPRRPRKISQQKGKRMAPPCLNLFRDECGGKKPRDSKIVGDDGGYGSVSQTVLDNLIQDVYKSYSSPSPDSVTADTIQDSLIKIIGAKAFDRILTSVSGKATFEELSKIDRFSDKMLPLFMLFIRMKNS